jgi:hypothetical protein
VRAISGRLAIAAAGFAMLGIGAVGLLTHTSDTHPAAWLRWLIGAALFHDLLLAPFVTLVGGLVLRVVPPPARAAVQAGLIVTGAVLIVGLVAILGPGRHHYHDNTSLLPLPYLRNLLIVLALVWFVTGLAAACALVKVKNRLRRQAP